MQRLDQALLDALGKLRFGFADEKIHWKFVSDENAVIGEKLIRALLTHFPVAFDDAAWKIITPSGANHFIHRFKLYGPENPETGSFQNIAVRPMTPLAGFQSFEFIQRFYLVEFRDPVFSYGQHSVSEQTQI